MTTQTTATRLLLRSLTAATVSASIVGYSSPDPRPTGSTTQSATPESHAIPTSSDAPAGGAYRDGTYDATGWYGGLPSHHEVTLTLTDDIITDVTVSTPAEDPTSLEYQQAFAAAIPGEVVGRHLHEVQIDRLAGASGCLEGFMDALQQIKTDAAA